MHRTVHSVPRPLNLPPDTAECVVRCLAPTDRLALASVDRAWCTAVLCATTAVEIRELLLLAPRLLAAPCSLVNTLSVREKQCGIDAGRRLCTIDSAVDAAVNKLQCVCGWTGERLGSDQKNDDQLLLRLVRACPTVRRSALRRARMADPSGDWFLACCSDDLFDELMEGGGGGGGGGDPCNRAQARRDAAVALVRDDVPFDKLPWARLVRLLRWDDSSTATEQLLCEMFTSGAANVHLEADQARALCVALSGRNCFITGAGGCGKSFVVELLSKAMRRASRRVAVLAPTRLAASRVRGATYHSWAGFRKHRIDREYVASPTFVADHTHGLDDQDSDDDEDGESTVRLPLDWAFVPVWNQRAGDNARLVDTVVIDEVSMVSEFNFRCLQMAVDRYREGKRDDPVQWILVGDFCQLPCIFRRNSVEEDALHRGIVHRFLFQSEAWQQLRLVPLLLRVNKRSSANVDFCAGLEQARLGDPRALLEFLKKQDKPSRQAAPQFGVFAKCMACNTYTRKRYAELAAEEVLLREWTEDCACGTQYWSRREQRASPRGVRVKIGASLRVTKGPLRDRIGTLVRIDDDFLVLRTETGDELKVWEHTSYRRCPGVEGGECDVGPARVFFPVEVRFGLTVHKAQGRSLGDMLVNVTDKFWESGQAYVAISRAVDPARLQIEDVQNLSFICLHAVKQLYKRLQREV